MAKKHMLIFHGGYYEGLSPKEVEAQFNLWFEWIDTLKKKGVYVGGDPLENGGKVVASRNGKIVIDGPYSESKELVAGYFLLEIASFEEAVEIAKGYPDFPFGGKVEVRGVMELPADK